MIGWKGKERKGEEERKGFSFYLCFFFLLLVLFLGGDFGWFLIMILILMSACYKTQSRRTYATRCSVQEGFFLSVSFHFIYMEIPFFLIPFLIWFCICVYIYIMRRRWLSSLQILNFASLNCFRGGLFTFRYKKVLLWRIIKAFDQDLVCCPFKL